MRIKRKRSFLKIHSLSYVNNSMKPVYWFGFMITLSVIFDLMILRYPFTVKGNITFSVKKGDNLSMELFAERLERLIKERKLTQIAVADAVGIRRPTISDWKKNGNYPTADVALKIAKLLGVSVEYLVSGDESSPLAEENRRLKEKLESIVRIAQG